MIQLPSTIPDVDVLLALAPEELAGTMLFLLRQRREGTFHPGNMQSELWGNQSRGLPGYPRDREADITLALAEAWAWLEAQGLIIPAEGINGQNGWRRLSRRARAMESENDFAGFRVARLLPKDILHPKIGNTVWLAFARGEYDVAVLQAMKAVEVAVPGANAPPPGPPLIGGEIMGGALCPPKRALNGKKKDPRGQGAGQGVFARGHMCR